MSRSFRNPKMEIVHSSVWHSIDVSKGEPRDRMDETIPFGFVDPFLRGMEFRSQGCDGIRCRSTRSCDRSFRCIGSVSNRDTFRDPARASSSFGSREEEEEEKREPKRIALEAIEMRTNMDVSIHPSPVFLRIRLRTRFREPFFLAGLVESPPDRGVGVCFDPRDTGGTVEGGECFFFC